MDLTSWLLQRTAPRPFVVTGLGGAATRLGVEREMRERGWTPALSPAAANLLLFCGSGASGLDDVVGRVWDQLARPRAREGLSTPERVGTQLDRAQEQLTDIHLQRADVDPPESTSQHGDMGMEMPGGLPMANRGPDRDGLILDQLHVPLGPALPDWPAGLALHLVLQGDVVQDVTVEVMGTAAGSYWAAHPTLPQNHRQAAAALDSLQRLLSVAGWPAAAMTGRRLRDDLLAGVAPESIRAVWSSWDRRIRRSRTLRWSTDRVGVRRDGDVTARAVRWLDITAAAWTGDNPPGVPERSNAAEDVLAELPTLLIGQELAAVRLIVASLDPDLEALTGVREQHSG